MLLSRAEYLFQRPKNRLICCLVVMVHLALQEKRVVTTKKRNHLHFWTNCSVNQNQALPNLRQKRRKSFHLWHNCVGSQMVDTVKQKFNSILILYTFSLQWSNTSFSVSNDAIEWSLDFGLDSVTLILKDLVHEMTIKFREIALAAWSLLLFQRQDFSNNHLARVLISPNSPNKEGTMEIRDEVLSNVCAQDMDTSGYQVSDLVDVQFHWEKDQLVSVCRPITNEPLSHSTFNDFEMGSIAVSPILVGEEQDKENSPPPHPTTRLREANPNLSVGEKSPTRNKDWKFSQLCL